MVIENKQMKHLHTTYSDSVHPLSVMQAAVYTIRSTSVLLENERMKLLILYTIHSGIVHPTKERRISSFKMKRADEAPMYYT